MRGRSSKQVTKEINKIEQLLRRWEERHPEHRRQLALNRRGRGRMVEKEHRGGWGMQVSLQVEGWEVEFLTGDDLYFLCRLDVRCLLKIVMKV